MSMSGTALINSFSLAGMSACLDSNSTACSGHTIPDQQQRQMKPKRASRKQEPTRTKADATTGAGTAHHFDTCDTFDNQ